MRVPFVESDDHIQGPTSARVTLIEYGDFQCPYCSVAHPIIKRVQDHFGNQLRFMFRHFPLRQIHPYAFAAAETAEYAASQGKFWAMHDWLFDHPQSLDRKGLREAVLALGLDVAEWEQAMRARTLEQKIQRDVKTGIDTGVDGTPTFFINGVRHDSSFDFRSLAGVIENALGH